jgi:hypothetical protein
MLEIAKKTVKTVEQPAEKGNRPIDRGREIDHWPPAREA